MAASAKAAGKPLRTKVLVPGATKSEFVEGGGRDAAVKPDDLFGDQSGIIAVDLLANYACELYESDNVIGSVNAENKIELREPVFPLFLVILELLCRERWPWGSCGRASTEAVNLSARFEVGTARLFNHLMCI
ncbi:hypothetical protein ACFORG_22215 [Lutimaribacter marinistellae]|uniref:Uncharacterized protein n=1 Tax=Lutimaribacter marinistellae TaxID=1820329 RepID=A0ABV7TPS3_9RHOB